MRRRWWPRIPARSALRCWAGCGGSASAASSSRSVVVRRLYERDHLDQVLATFALILIINQGANMLFGRQPLFVSIPAALSGSVTLLPGLVYPVYRLLVIVLGLSVAAGLFSADPPHPHRHAGARRGHPSPDGAGARGQCPAALHAGVRPRCAAGRARGRRRRPDHRRCRSAWASRS